MKNTYFSDQSSRWRRTIEGTWVYGQGMISGGGDASQLTIYNSEGKLNMATLERYRKSIHGGEWWLGKHSDRIPFMKSTCILLSYLMGLKLHLENFQNLPYITF
jgi:hypothetical protein